MDIPEVPQMSPTGFVSISRIEFRAHTQGWTPGRRACLGSLGVVGAGTKATQISREEGRTRKENFQAPSQCSFSTPPSGAVDGEMRAQMRATSNLDMCPGSLNEEAGRGWLALPKFRAWLRLHPSPSEPCPLTSPSPANKPLTLSLSPGDPQGPCDLTGRNPPRFSSNHFFFSACHSDQINRPLLLGENVSTGPRRQCPFPCLMGLGRESREVCVCACVAPPAPPSPVPREGLSHLGWLPSRRRDHREGRCWSLSCRRPGRRLRTHCCPLCPHSSGCWWDT